MGDINHSHKEKHISHKYNETHYKYRGVHYFVELKKLANDRIDGTQIPTNRPSSLIPPNHKDTENKKLIKAKRIG